MHPVSVIKEAEELAADAFGAAHAFFMVGGTTSAVQSMVLAACKKGDKIILPRNVHRSVINALILCGALPVYVNPATDQRLGIALGMPLGEVEKAHPGESGRQGDFGQQPNLLRHLLQSEGHHRFGPTATGCWYWWTKPTAPISISEKTCHPRPCRWGRT